MIHCRCYRGHRPDHDSAQKVMRKRSFNIRRRKRNGLRRFIFLRHFSRLIRDIVRSLSFLISATPWLARNVRRPETIPTSIRRAFTGRTCGRLTRPKWVLVRVHFDSLRYALRRPSRRRSGVFRLISKHRRFLPTSVLRGRSRTLWRKAGRPLGAAFITLGVRALIRGVGRPCHLFRVHT